MVVDQVRLELLALQATDPDNLLHTQKAVDWARENEESALHRRLNWDNESAANSWRCEQVRRLIKYHVVTETGAPQLISLQVDRSAGGGYRDINQARTSMAEIMLREALRTLKMIRNRFGHIRKLQPLWTEIDRAYDKELPAPPTLRDRSRSRPAVGA